MHFSKPALKRAGFIIFSRIIPNRYSNLESNYPIEENTLHWMKSYADSSSSVLFELFPVIL